MKAIDSILLVDDDKINNYINQRLILKSGFCNDIVIKHNGEDALFYLQNLNAEGYKIPNLILLDINMPVINGIEFIELLHKIDNPVLNSIKICILSTSENESDLQKIKQLGNFYFVSKPLTQQKLMDIYCQNFDESD